MELTKWNEINSATLRYLMNCYLKNESWTIGTIVEIQNPVAILNKDYNRRFYFGGETLIGDFDSFRSFDQPYLDLLDSINELGEDMGKESLCFCSLDDKEPVIMPIFDSVNYNTLLFQMLGDPLCDNIDTTNFIDLKYNKWYLKRGDQRLVDLSDFSFKKYSATERIFRIRTINYEVWKTNILDFSKGNELKYKNQDEKFGTTKKNK